MKKIISKIVATFAVLLFVGINAQQKTIEEVNLKGDNFKELKTLIQNNFDYTNPNLQEGTTDALVKFEVAENGAIKNVHAASKCKHAALEMEKVMQELIYKFRNERLYSKTYVMPVTIAIASK